ncbi:hypothetical protein PBY51_023423 [Eleginops maclovinus]|uniref:Uncharacterized protein n=1 Tax=Eleginops maclovinus TaxID=56733 RepID=A0AAN8ADK2_ELEMC|nr:hypothetical protein PBY51_023423 [Eleginops maclovinus]
MEAQKVYSQEKCNLPAHCSGSACRYYFPLNEAFSAAAHSGLLAAGREFRQRDLFTWSRSVLLIGGASRVAARSHLYGERQHGA